MGLADTAVNPIGRWHSARPQDRFQSARGSVQFHVPNWEKATGWGDISVQASFSSAALITHHKAASK